MSSNAKTLLVWKRQNYWRLNLVIARWSMRLLSQNCLKHRKVSNQTKTWSRTWTSNWTRSHKLLDQNRRLASDQLWLKLSLHCLCSLRWPKVLERLGFQDNHRQAQLVENPQRVFSKLQPLNSQTCLNTQRLYHRLLPQDNSKHSSSASTQRCCLSNKTNNRAHQLSRILHWKCPLKEQLLLLTRASHTSLCQASLPMTKHHQWQRSFSNLIHRQKVCASSHSIVTRTSRRCSLSSNTNDRLATISLLRTIKTRSWLSAWTRQPQL